MKVILSFAILFFSLSAFAQYDSTKVLQTTFNSYGYEFKNIKVKGPLGLSSDTVKMAVKDSNFIVLKGSSVYKWNGYKWISVGGGSGVGGTTYTGQAPIVVTGSVISADTAKAPGKLATFTDVKIVESQGVANAAAIQQRIDSLRNNAGTLEARKGGVFVPQFVLPSGGGSNLNLATNYIRALNDSTIYFDSSLVVTSVTGINDSTIRITKGNGATNDVQIKGGANTGGGSGITVSSYGKNASRDSTILLLSDGTRYAAKDSVGSGGGGSAAGSNKEIQFNNSGAFGATPNFKWDGQVQITPTFVDTVGYLEGIKITGSDADAVAVSIKNTFSTTGREYKLISRGDGSFAIQRLIGIAGTDVFSFNNLNKATFSGVLEGPSSAYTLGNATGIGNALWIGVSPANSNYAIYSDGASNYFNSGSDMLFRTGNANKGRIFNSTGSWIFGASTTDNGSQVQTTSFSTAYTATATGLTADATHNVIDVTATGQTITLPTSVGKTGRQYTIKLTASGTGTVATTSSQTIDGITTYSLSAQYKYVMVQSTGSNWIIIANN